MLEDNTTKNNCKRMIKEAQAELIGLVAHEAAGSITKHDIVPEYLNEEDWRNAISKARTMGLVVSEGRGNYRLGRLDPAINYEYRLWIGRCGAWTGTFATAAIRYSKLIVELAEERTLLCCEGLAETIGCPEDLFDEAWGLAQSHPNVDSIDYPEIIAYFGDEEESCCFEHMSEEFQIMLEKHIGELYEADGLKEFEEDFKEEWE